MWVTIDVEGIPELEQNAGMQFVCRVSHRRASHFWSTCFRASSRVSVWQRRPRVPPACTRWCWNAGIGSRPTWRTCDLHSTTLCRTCAICSPTCSITALSADHFPISILPFFPHFRIQHGAHRLPHLSLSLCTSIWISYYSHSFSLSLPDFAPFLLISFSIHSISFIVLFLLSLIPAEIRMIPRIGRIRNRKNANRSIVIIRAYIFR